MANTEKYTVAKQKSNSEFLPVSLDKESITPKDQNFSNKVCAIIISYNPNDVLYQSIKQLSLVIGKIFIIDNNSLAKNKDILFKLLRVFDKVEVKLNQSNLGIACALNQGIKLAIESGFEWVITLDQDSKFEAYSLEKMFCLAEYLNKRYEVGIIAPIYKLEYKKPKRSFHKSNFLDNKSIKTEHGKYKFIFTAMTSGNLIPVKVFQEIGCFDSDFFIDYVDFEFCLRLNKNGYKIFQATDIVLEHALGSSLEKGILFNLIKLRVSVHSPERIYYKYRNRFITYKRYIFIFPGWVFIDFLSIPKEILKINLVSSERLAYIKNILKGIFEGLYLEK